VNNTQSIRQLLLVDADDTLWENNIYFERVIDRFLSFVNHARLTHAEVRETLNRIERANAPAHGYGTKSFTRNLMQAFAEVAPERDGEENRAAIREMARVIREHPVELIEGVRETLEGLAARHTLILFTKGDPAEQRSKVERSGLGDYFREARIVAEKDAAAYRAMVDELRADPARTWMIGNSPRSDINPALEAGINAVWIPHDATWVLEHEEVRGGPGRVLRLSRFAELRDYF
jgi:putative hydrolase of the HAD superfamily